MVLPLLLGLAGSALGGTGALGAMGALGAGALGSGLGRFIETGDLGKGIETGLTSFIGGQALSSIGKMASIDSLAKAGELGTSGATDLTLKTGLETLKNPAVLGQSVIGQASVPPPMPPPVAPVPFENRQAGVPQRTTRRPPPGYRPGYDAEFDYGVSPNYGVGLMNPNDPRFMNSGGIISLSNGGELKPIPEGNKGLPNLPKDVRNKMGFMQEGGAVEGDMEANKIIDDAVNAIKGLSDSPEIALGVFVAKYGEEALEDLIERVNDGEFDQPREDNMIEGEGDGMDDKVPATLEGQQDVMLSDGEFVVPADVVSGIGNGSSDAGARELEDMMTRVRQLRTGKMEQPEQVPQEMMLPV
tara:strand:- start:370 stop:1443 length:1074 start_codon:yes stop_codon:yes gene_type:complete